MFYIYSYLLDVGERKFMIRSVALPLSPAPVYGLSGMRGNQSLGAPNKVYRVLPEDTFGLSRG